MARTWYAYRPDIGSDKSDPANYRLVPDHATVGSSPCFTGPQICAIYAIDNGATPSSPFSNRLLAYINSSLTTSVPLPSTVGAKPYLYKKAT